MDTFRSHCTHCGAQYPAEQLAQGRHAPRQCSECNALSWFNPTPIAVLLQPVHRTLHNTLQYGLLVGQRAIQPKLGEWGLPGGFVDPGDYSYELAALREAREEVDLPRMPRWTEVVGVPRLMQSLPGDAGQILAFSQSECSIPLEWLDPFTPCHECSAVRVAWQPEALCFSSHTAAMAVWFHEFAQPLRGPV